MPIHVQGVSTSPIVIEDETWIGANVVVRVLPLVGIVLLLLGSVLQKIPPYSVAVGNPC
jgi:acetyltransferase-like isoleucine patch superfamily enzyme